MDLESGDQARRPPSGPMWVVSLRAAEFLTWIAICLTSFLAFRIFAIYLTLVNPEEAAQFAGKGTPKGVLVPHRAVVNLLSSMAERPGMGPGDKVVAITTYAFDIAAVELWLPLVWFLIPR